MPQRPDLSFKIHPIIKWLHFICEQLIPSEVALLVKCVCDKFPDDRYQLRNIPEPSSSYLEMWLLVWLSERLVEAGDWSPTGSSRNRKIHCRLDAILVAMKSSGNAKLQSLHLRLEMAKNRFNCTSSNVITFDPKKKTLSEQQLGDGDTTTQFSSSSSGGRTAIQMPNATPKTNYDEDDDDRYVLRSHKIGIALIINQEKFHVTKVKIIILANVGYNSYLGVV